MALYPYLSPLFVQCSIFIDQERAALDSHVLFTVELFEFDDFEQFTERLIRVRDQLKWELLLGFESFMGFHAVPGYAENHGVGGRKSSDLIAKVLSFSSAAWGAVPWVEVDYDLLAFQA